MLRSNWFLMSCFLCVVFKVHRLFHQPFEHKTFRFTLESLVKPAFEHKTFRFTLESLVKPVYANSIPVLMSVSIPATYVCRFYFNMGFVLLFLSEFLPFCLSILLYKKVVFLFFEAGSSRCFLLFFLNPAATYSPISSPI